MKVLVVSQRLAERLAELLPAGIEIVTPETRKDEELIDLARDVEVIVSTRLSSEVAKASKRLKLLQKTGAGVDAMPFDALREDTYLANTSGANPTPLAEGTVALLLSLAKQVVQRDKDFLMGRGGSPGFLLKGKNAGILGLGSIGREVARMLQAFDMRILAMKRNPSEELKDQLKLDFLGGPQDLHFILSESDFIVITLPLTTETRGLIGEEEFRLMKPSSNIINVARAAIIQEEPLYRALKEGRISGAALDVWWVPHWWDPIWNPEGKGPSKYPFWEMPNVITTPHLIGSTYIRSDAALRIIAKNIELVAEGKPPINLVDKKLQY